MQITITHTLVQKWGESDLYLLRNYLFKLLYPNSSRNLRRLFCVLSLLGYEVCDKMVLHIVSRIYKEYTDHLTMIKSFMSISMDVLKLILFTSLVKIHESAHFWLFTALDMKQSRRCDHIYQITVFHSVYWYPSLIWWLQSWMHVWRMKYGNFIRFEVVLRLRCRTTSNRYQ